MDYNENSLSPTHPREVNTNEPLPIMELKTLKCKKICALMQKEIYRISQLVTKLMPKELEKIMKRASFCEDEPKELPLETNQDTLCEVRN